VTSESASSIPIDLDEVLDHAIQAAKLAADILVDRFGSLEPGEIQKKAATDFVTEVDTEAENAIIEYIRGHYPGHSIFAEESGTDTARSDFQWLIDPLDGTKNYIHGLPNYAVSIGFSYGSEIVTSVIYIPPRDELFTAIKGKGAYLNDAPIHVSTASDFSSCMIVTGFPHARKEYLDVYLDCFKSLFLQVSAIRRPGAAAVDLAYLACGRHDGFWEFKLNPWDIAAGVLLIKEAGGVVSDPFGGGNYFETGDLVAGNSEIHKRIVETIGPISEGRLGWVTD
jgi:myo-inositol-1(or 4)-monophosphatase